jgi:hypothetical protein
MSTGPTKKPEQSALLEVGTTEKSKREEEPKEKDPAIRAERLQQAKRRLEADKKMALAADKEKRLKKIRQVQQDLEQEAKKKSEQKGQSAEQARPDPKGRLLHAIFAYATFADKLLGGTLRRMFTLRKPPARHPWAVTNTTSR